MVEVGDLAFDQKDSFSVGEGYTTLSVRLLFLLLQCEL